MLNYCVIHPIHATLATFWEEEGKATWTWLSKLKPRNSHLLLNKTQAYTSTEKGYLFEYNRWCLHLITKGSADPTQELLCCYIAYWLLNEAVSYFLWRYELWNLGVNNSFIECTFRKMPDVAMSSRSVIIVLGSGKKLMKQGTKNVTKMFMTSIPPFILDNWQ